MVTYSLALRKTFVLSQVASFFHGMPLLLARMIDKLCLFKLEYAAKAFIFPSKEWSMSFQEKELAAFVADDQS